MPEADRFHFENPEDADNEISVYIEDDKRFEAAHVGKLVVSVTDESAVGSYNISFSSSIHLSEEAAKRLRDYLNEKFPA